MNSLLYDKIKQLLQEEVAFNANDNLVDITRANNKTLDFYGSFTYMSQEVPKTLIREIRLEIKENGINPLCLSMGAALVRKNEKEYKTPILLTPLKIEADKVRNEVLFQKDGETFINPYLIRVLSNDFDLDTTELTYDNVQSWLQEKGFEIDEKIQKIGSFHHHRYAIVKELEELLTSDSLSEPLLSLFGEFEAESKLWKLPVNDLLPADTDHLKVFASLGKTSTVVQGPPGTGKTQVLVNIIGKALFSNKKMTVVSEKHVALQVVQKKLHEIGLDKLSYIAASEHNNSSFIRSLEKSWKFFEEHEFKQPIELGLSTQHEQRLQLILDTVNKPGLATGISYLDFLDRFQPVRNSDFIYQSKLPSMREFLDQEDLVNDIYKNELNFSIGFFKAYSLNQNILGILDQKIECWINEIKLLNNHFHIQKWSDLDIAMKQAADIQIFENELVKQHAEILTPGTGKRKKFERIFKKWNSHPLRDKNMTISSHWKIRPDSLELLNLGEKLKSSFFKRLTVRNRWRQLSHLPFHMAKIAVDEEIQIQQNEGSLSKILNDFCELGIDDPSANVSQLKSLTGYLSKDKWEVFHSITDKEKYDLHAFHKQLRSIHDEINSHFRMDAEDNLIQVLTKIKKDLGEILSISSLNFISDDSLALIRHCDSWNNYQAVVLHSHRVNIEKTYPTLKDFDPSKLDKLIEELLSIQTMESKQFVQHILFNFSSKFHEFQHLLSTPARKLTEPEKKLKQKLKKGKSILVKEFGKSRRHLSLRELFSTEARLWIQLLKPVWLSNPSYLAKSLPLEKNIFDLSVFDESTQIPLQNALGTLQRSKRTLIAGDEHQMGPSNYFNSSGSETEDLLNQAMYHLNSVSLKHHYRSKYPDLIRFSNKYFYNNELLVYPSPQQPEKVIDFRFIEGGIFHERKNIKEAKASAKLIVEALRKNVQTGIVAFSEEQLGLIKDCLDPETILMLTKKIENDGWFFKALENLQGDECDHLIISFGYGRNSEGEFHHRFGPMNQLSGRNRLNVLMTRSKEKMTLISSIKSKDFKISDNESVNLLKEWVRYFENPPTLKSNIFPYNIESEVKNRQLLLRAVLSKVDNIRELATLFKVLKSRGWNLFFD